MLRYRVVPHDTAQPPVELITQDPSSVLHVVERMSCEDADVLLEGRYTVSVHLSRNGLWTIFKRGSAIVAPAALHRRRV